MTLGIKIGRRLTAAVALADERFTFRDSRYAIKRRDVQVLAFDHYIRQLLEQVKPSAIYYYAPAASKSLADALVNRLIQLAGQAGVPIRPLTRMDMFGSFGVLPVRTRRELREIVSAIWPELATAVVGRQEALAEAAAAALVGDLQQAWPPV